MAKGRKKAGKKMPPAIKAKIDAKKKVKKKKKTGMGGRKMGK